MAGLYIHIPYCHSKCSYCDFCSTPKVDTAEDYITALIDEYRLRKDEVNEPLSTVYIGGGTPSILPMPTLSRLVESLGHPVLEEFTIEANPEDVTPEWVDAIIRIGINRVSIGIQSLVDSELKAINRRHSAARAEEALMTLKSGGIAEISGDLIYGLPGQSLESWNYSLNKLIGYGLTHISAYNLSYEPGTRLYAQLISGKVNEASDETIESMYALLTDSLRKNGYEHYEISNFAQPGHRAHHNSNYWNMTPYIGLGVSAHSFDGKTRRANGNRIKDYIKSINSANTYYEVEEESPENILNDYIITALRTRDGINLNDMRLRFNSDTVENLLSSAKRYIASGRLIKTDESLSLSETAILISDSIFRDLIV